MGKRARRRCDFEELSKKNFQKKNQKIDNLSFILLSWFNCSTETFNNNGIKILQTMKNKYRNQLQSVFGWKRFLHPKNNQDSYNGFSTKSIFIQLLINDVLNYTS
jgi:hypothetical protein